MTTKPAQPGERFMRQHYGASGFVDEKKVMDDLCLAAVKYCNMHELDYTLGTMHEMAKFALEVIRDERD